MRRAAIATHAAAAAAVALACSGCGSAPRGGALADAGVARGESGAGTCGAVVLEVLGRVATRIYHEGVASERTQATRHLIARSRALSSATERGDAAGARAAAEALLATQHMAGLRVMRGGSLLASVGVARGLAPLSGAITGTRGMPVGRYLATVWSYRGLIAETEGLTGAAVLVREGSHSLAGRLRLRATPRQAQGTVTLQGIASEYFSFPATAYPTGSPLRVFVVRSIPPSSPLCGNSTLDTIANTASEVARNIYSGEEGPRRLIQVQRVQRDQPLLNAVATRDPAATRSAIDALLHQHLVRLRVSAGAALLADVGGPYVLAPVSAPLRLRGHTIGQAVLSIQDDQGYLRLAKRLAGLEVLMYMGSKLVQSSFVGSAPAAVPSQGPFSYRGRSFTTYTFKAQAFPSGPLRITVLIPIPYS